jgi:pimeloyl-ACP methyl ester carboxylesterase
MTEPAATQFLAFPPEIKSTTGATQLLETTISGYDLDRPLFALAVEDRESGIFVGMCGLNPLGTKTVEIFYAVAPEVWGRGFGTEIASRLVRYAIDDLRIECVKAFIVPSNSRSIHLDPWVWERMTPLLDLPALAVRRAAPGTNLNRLTTNDCAKYIQSEIEAAGLEKVILVAHSIGGVIAPVVATLLPDRVVQMVFVGATIPPEGRSAISVFRPSERFGMAVWLRLKAWNLTFMDKAVNEDMRKTRLSCYFGEIDT